MPNALSDFVGTYVIEEGGGRFGVIETKQTLCIGTGLFGDPPSDGIRVGVSIIDKKTKQRVLPRKGTPPVFAYLVDGTLNGTSYWPDDDGELQLISYQITMMTSILPNGGVYKAPTLRIFIGDPENVGVWGANDDTDDPPADDPDGG